MSYNTRSNNTPNRIDGSGRYYSTSTYNTNIAGANPPAPSPTRRSNSQTGNLIPGGTLTPQQSPVVQQSYQQQQAKPSPQQQPKAAQQLSALVNIPTNAQPVETKMDLASAQTNNGDSIKSDATDGENPSPRRHYKAYGRKKFTGKELRSRRNKRMGKLLRPKNAVMVLNELCGSTALKYEDKVTQPGEPHRLTLTIDGSSYEGSGLSKTAARQRAAENALKNYLSNKLSARAAKQAAGVIVKDETNMEMDVEEDEQDVAWCQLASFALFKLMDGWQEEGTPIVASDLTLPVGLAKNKGVAVAVAGPKQPKPLPANAAEIHPVMLLNQMRPGITYVDHGFVGTPPNNRVYTVKCSVDDQEFFGHGTNKKLARKDCAMNAVNKIFGLVYNNTQQ